MSRFFKKKIPGTLGLEVSPFGVAAAYLRPEGDEQQRGWCRYFEGADGAYVSDLSDWLQELGIEGVSVQVVLHPTLYQVHFVDRPEVEEADLAEAVRWKLKDMIETPLMDLIVDVFAVPNDAYRGNQQKVYAVTILKELLEDIVGHLHKLPMEIRGITISELADRTMLNRFHVEGGGAALLRLRSANGTINLIDGGDLYLTRTLDSGISILETATDDNRQQVMDELLLEVQRCLDFYDSQLGKGAIRKMLVAPTRLHRNFFDDHLRGNLNLTVHALDLNEAFEFEEPLSGDLQGICFGAVAAAADPGLKGEVAS